MATEFVNILFYISVFTILSVGTAAAHTYVTTDGKFYGIVFFAVRNDIADWKSCEQECRNHGSCQTFIYGDYQQRNRVCRLTKVRIVFGSLTGSGLVTGQLASTAQDAPLQWVGIGWFYPHSLRKTTADIAISNMTHDECQAECDSSEADAGLECAAYTIVKDKGICETFRTGLLMLTTASATRATYGIREDMVNQTKIVGDSLGTRVPPSEFPPAPPDIGDSVPDYNEIEFHYEKGLRDWSVLRKVWGGTATWEICSMECHQTSDCVSFLFSVSTQNNDKTCKLYDALLLGRAHPGYGKYGVIDRAKGEGAVSSLVDAGSADGFYIYWEKNLIESMDECAKLCYHFYRPKMCIGFFFDLPNKMCKLYDAIPCTASNQDDKPKAFQNGEWNVVKYRFAYIDSRVPTHMRMKMYKYRMCDPKAATYETKTEVCHNGTSSMQIPLGGSGVETDEELQLICATHCFAKRQWCHWYQMNAHSRICHLYTREQQMGGGGNDEGCVYGKSTR